MIRTCCTRQGWLAPCSVALWQGTPDSLRSSPMPSSGVTSVRAAAQAFQVRGTSCELAASLFVLHGQHKNDTSNGHQPTTCAQRMHAARNATYVNRSLPLAYEVVQSLHLSSTCRHVAPPTPFDSPDLRPGYSPGFCNLERLEIDLPESRPANQIGHAKPLPFFVTHTDQGATQVPVHARSRSQHGGNEKCSFQRTSPNASILRRFGVGTSSYRNVPTDSGPPPC